MLTCDTLTLSSPGTSWPASRRAYMYVCVCVGVGGGGGGGYGFVSMCV